MYAVPHVKSRILGQALETQDSDISDVAGFDVDFIAYGIILVVIYNSNLVTVDINFYTSLLGGVYVFMMHKYIPGNT